MSRRPGDEAVREEGVSEARAEQLEAVRLSLPAPFRAERFTLLRTGIHDDPETTVYLNEPRDFAFLFPQPWIDYGRYEPRFRQLGLGVYRRRNEVVERRFAKIATYFETAHSVLEIGAADARFLRHARQENPHLVIASVEVDENSRSERDQVEGLAQFSRLAEALVAGRRFELVCFFHVLEHVLEPAPFLAACRDVLAPGGRMIVEIPSLDDPLLALFVVPEYEAFYFQRQHPYVYSARSVARLLESHGFGVERVIAHQRYGLENHLTWLGKRRPGGDEALRSLVEPVDGAYRERLEAVGFADAVIVIAAEER